MTNQAEVRCTKHSHRHTDCECKVAELLNRVNPMRWRVVVSVCEWHREEDGQRIPEIDYAILLVADDRHVKLRTFSTHGNQGGAYYGEPVADKVQNYARDVGRMLGQAKPHYTRRAP